MSEILEGGFRIPDVLKRNLSERITQTMQIRERFVSGLEKLPVNVINVNMLSETLLVPFVQLSVQFSTICTI